MVIYDYENAKREWRECKQVDETLFEPKLLVATEKPAIAFIVYLIFVVKYG